MLETHSSVIFLIGALAFKLKKPVDLGFLDWTSRPARQLACSREVELNRRLAPDVYLGVADVRAPDGSPLDHLVMMRRMPADRMLSTLAAGGAALHPEIREVAQKLAEFHASAETSKTIRSAGAPGRMLQLWDDNFRSLRQSGPDVIDSAEIDEAEGHVHRYFAGRAPMLHQRVEVGLIRDGHGDLQADDVFLLPDGPRLLDCLDFDDRLRHGDVLSDAAFLAMDLERLGRKDLAAEFLHAYCNVAAETHPATLLDLYIAYRAQVRAKVKCISAAQGDPEAAGEAQILHRLSLQHLRAASVRLVVVGGAPATGKSTLARLLGNQRGWMVLSSDEVRRELLGDSADQAGRYSARAKDQVYAAILSRAELLLGMGESVVVDATWAQPRWRAAAADVAKRTTSEFHQFRCDVAPDVARQRATARRASGEGASQAGPQEADLVRAQFAAWSEAVTLQTAAVAGQTLQELASHLDGH